MRDRAVDDDQELVDFERLLQVVERAKLHRLDRALDGRVRRHHENLRAVAGGGVRHDLADELDARELGHQVVGNQQVEWPLADEPERLARAAGRRHLVAFVAQRLGERLPDLRLVVDQQDGPARHDTTSGVILGVVSGRSIRTVVPTLTRLSTAIVPPSPSTTFRAMASPRPDPPRRVVKNGSKSRGEILRRDARARGR